MRSFLAGIIVSGLLLITSIFLNNSSMIMFLLLLLGVVPLIISGLLSGTFLSGDRIRANYSEPKEFSERSRIGSMFFLFGIPCLSKLARRPRLQNSVVFKWGMNYVPLHNFVEAL